MEFPTGHYAARLNDHILRYGALVGLSTDPVYSPNERAWISHAMVTADLAERDARFGALWGENDGGTAKPHV
jgi:hypothetical protein